MRWRRGVTVVFLAAGLASGPVGLAGPAVVAAGVAVRQQRVDYDRSTIVAVLHKAGLLRFLGHEHGILVKDWSAEVEYDPARPEQTKVSVTVRTPTLEIDSAPARRLAAVDPDGANEEQTLEIRDQMLGTEQLDAETYPTMTFVSTGVERRSDRELRLRGTLSVHGRRRAIEVSGEARTGCRGGAGNRGIRDQTTRLRHRTGVDRRCREGGRRARHQIRRLLDHRALAAPGKSRQSFATASWCAASLLTGPTSCAARSCWAPERCHSSSPVKRLGPSA